MTGFNPGAPASVAIKWHTIKWDVVRDHVRRLQMRIAKAVKEGKRGKVKALQWLLTHSFNAKLLAIKRVTTNKGKKTPGVDGILWKSNKVKIQAALNLQRHGYQNKPMEALVRAINPVLRGWANYHRHVLSSKAFYRVDSYVYSQLWRMLRRRHSNKSKTWLFKKYWTATGREHVFSFFSKYKKKARLLQIIQLNSIKLREHLRIRVNANPYMPEYSYYFWRRRNIKGSKLRGGFSNQSDIYSEMRALL